MNTVFSMNLGQMRSLLLTAAALMFCANGSAQAKNIGLLIGVGDYAAPQIERLIGPPNDVTALKQRLEQKLGFASPDITVLVNSAATKANILAELERLYQRSEPGDNVLIYYSGHGTSAGQDGNSFDLPYLTGAWLPYDLPYTTLQAAKAGLIVGSRDLRPRLKALDDGGRIVVVLTDSCYSGQLVRSTAALLGPLRLATLPGTSASKGIEAPRSAPPPYPYANVLMISAASDSEAAMDISGPAFKRWSTIDGLPHGAFTDTLLRMLDGQLAKGEQSYSRAFQAIASHMQRQGYPHEPQLLPSMSEDTKSLATKGFLQQEQASSLPVSAVKTESTQHESQPLLSLRIDESAKSLKKHFAGLTTVSIVDGIADLALQIKGNDAQLTSGSGDLILSTDKVDVDLIRRVNAESWIKKLGIASGQSYGLRVETNPSTRGGTFTQCERFSFQVQVQRKAYVTLLDLTSRGYLRVLYPLPRDIGAPLAPGKVFALPGSSPADQIVVDPPFGTDVLITIATDMPPTFLPKLARDAEFDVRSDAAMSISNGLEKAAGKFEVSRTNIRTYPNGVGGKCP